MARDSALMIRFRAVTPAFLGGAAPDEQAELRVPSFKGLLRYWYRALDAHFRDHEARLFGSSGARSPCMVRVAASPRVCATSWDSQRYSRPIGAGGFQRGSGTSATNGIGYLGYTLNLGSRRRKAIPAGNSFELWIEPRTGIGGEQLRRAWAAAAWLLAHVGGVGSRARRGLGSLAIEGWSGWPECNELPLPCQAATPDEWADRFTAAVDVLWRWYPDPHPAADHTVLAEGCRVTLLEQAFDDWEHALDHAGRELQSFRQRSASGHETDYQWVRNHLAQRHARTLTRRGARLPAGLAPAFLTEAPARAAFGLPLTFRYGSLPVPPITFQGTTHERMASPLFVRVVKLGDGYHGLFAKLLAPMLAPGELVKDREDKRGLHPWPWPTAASTLLDRFMDAIAARGIEVSI